MDVKTRKTSRDRGVLAVSWQPTTERLSSTNHFDAGFDRSVRSARHRWTNHRVTVPKDLRRRTKVEEPPEARRRLTNARPCGCEWRTGERASGNSRFVNNCSFVCSRCVVWIDAEDRIHEREDCCAMCILCSDRAFWLRSSSTSDQFLLTIASLRFTHLRVR